LVLPLLLDWLSYLPLLLLLLQLVLVYTQVHLSSKQHTCANTGKCVAAVTWC